MMSTLQIAQFVEPPVLQHLQESFAAQKQLAILIFDPLGQPLTEPSRHCRINNDAALVLNPFLDFILQNPPRFADLGLSDGNTVYASFFGGLFHRAILPVMLQRQSLGAVQIVATHDPDSFDLARWRYILEGFTWNNVSYLAFLDSQPSLPLSELVQDAALLQSQLSEMLASGLHRRKKQRTTAASTPPAPPDRGALVVNRFGDILSASTEMAALLHYDSPLEMVGLNVVEHLTLTAGSPDDLRACFALETPADCLEIMVQTKDGALQPLKLQGEPQSDEHGQPIGVHWRVVDSTPPIHGEGAASSNSKAWIAEPLPERQPPETGHPEQPADDSGAWPSDSSAQPADDSNDGLKDGSAQPADEEGEAAITEAMRAAVDELRYPLFAVDPQNRIVLWNQKLSELLHISARSVAALDFANLLVGDSQHQWQRWLFGFRINRDAVEYKPADLLYILDNGGEIYSILIELSKTEIPGSRLIAAIIRSCEKAALPPQPYPLLLDLEPERAGGEEEVRGRRAAPVEPERLALLLEKRWLPFAERLQQVLQTLEPDPGNRENVRLLRQEAETLTRLFQQLQFIAGQPVPVLAAVRLKRILHQAAITQELLFAPSRPIEWLLPGEELLVQGDMVQMYYAVIYLLDFIRQRMREDHAIRIAVTRASAPEGWGPMAAAAQAVLLEISYVDSQAAWPEPARWPQSVEAGSEIGLAAVQAIIHAHRGAFRIVQSSEERRAFQIYLPPALRMPRPHGGSATVLVIDDEPGIVQMNTLMLEHSGFKVLAALNGQEGLRLLEENIQVVAAVLLDWKLPDISCPDMAAAISRITTAPLVITSGYLPDAQIRAVIDKYNVTFLQKPYTLATLVQLIGESIG